MMDMLRYTLVSDGSSDRALLPLLTWILCSNGVTSAIDPQWADLSRVRLLDRSLAEKIRFGVELYPCDLLFVHRDAEQQPASQRISEIEAALWAIPKGTILPKHICVIPIRMLETWLLFDEDAIKYAAGNRSYRMPLDLPDLTRLEQLPDPKTELHQRLKAASGLTGRRLKSFRVYQAAIRVSEFIDDFSRLRALTAFNTLESDIRNLILNNHEFR